MSTAKEKHINLNQYQHPQDARVIVAPDIAIFKQAATLNRGLVILKTSNEKKEQLQQIFGAVARTSFPYYCSYITGNANGPKNNLEYKYINDDDTSESIQKAKKILENLCPIFHESSGTEKSSFQLYTNFFARTDSKHDGLHTHHAAMNFSIFDKGTIWPNEEGKILQADEGDIVYIPEGFRHGSPKTRKKERLIAIYQDMRHVWLS